MRRYHLVDFAAHYQPGFRNHIVSIEEVSLLVESYKAFECHTSYFFFPPEVLTFMELHPVKEHPSIGGYDGKVWASYLPIDLDAPTLDCALEQARLLAQELFVHQGLSPESCPLYFSGAKGFHFMIDARLLGHIIPSKNLHLVFSQFRKELILDIPQLKTDVIDLTIKDKVRLLRLPNTINQKTQKYKIPLLPEELMHNSIPEILEKANGPRELFFTDSTGLISNTKTLEENKGLSRLFHKSKRIIQGMTRLPFQYPIKPKMGKDPEKFLCPGFLEIWHSHVGMGERNNCMFRLISEFRHNGLTKEESLKLIQEWNDRNKILLGEREINRTLESAYARRFPYLYKCSDSVLQSYCPLKTLSQCNNWLKEMKSA